MRGVQTRVGIIPARALSTRFPFKVLAPIAGKPLVQRVWEAAQGSRLLHKVLVATDDTRVAQAVRGFGGEAVMTPPSLPSGTDRVFHAVQGLDADVVVNLQGDEPLLEAQAIDALIEGLEAGDFGMATLAIPTTNPAEWASPHVVKVRFGPGGKVLDFSRDGLPSEQAGFCKHLGIYAFRRETLEKFCALRPSPREVSERLEQLRAMENGIAIRAVVWERDTVAVDVPEDIARVEAVLKERDL
ncbi:3-deoxy-manno-octulosonate cytidylyltransferase [bacterium]|nr:3-deoxy-manno-octulosonate cytidylyltransferase [bacterium]